MLCNVQGKGLNCRVVCNAPAAKTIFGINVLPLYSSACC